MSLLGQQQKQFIGSVTHEFKTPLTSIQAYLDLRDMYPDDAELLVTARRTMQSETQRLYEYNKQRLEVEGTIRSVLDGLRGKMDKFGLTLEIRLVIFDRVIEQLASTMVM